MEIEDKIIDDLCTKINKICALVDEADHVQRAGTEYIQIPKQELIQTINDMIRVFNSFEENLPQLQTNARIFGELREIKESLKTQSAGQPQTWSQVAAQPPPAYSVAEHRALERAKERKEREIIVTIRDQKEREEITGKDRNRIIQKIKE
jgi:hypothetical protein